MTVNMAMAMCFLTIEKFEVSSGCGNSAILREFRPKLLLDNLIRAG